MPLLFEQQVAVTLGTARHTGLRTSFRVLHSLKPDPNVCEVTLYNLNADSRRALQGTAPISAIVEAGYGKDLQLLFKGDLRRAASTRQGTDWVTTLRAGDGETKLRTARINESVTRGTPIRTVFERVAKKLGVNLGDTLQRINSASHRQNLTEYISGAVLSGPVRSELDKLMQEHNLEWSVQDGTIVTLPRGTATSAEAVLLTSSTGLVGSPEAGEKGIIKFKSLLQPSIRPGRKVKVESALLSGFYRVEQAVHIGDTHGTVWHTEIEGRPL